MISICAPAILRFRSELGEGRRLGMRKSRIVLS
jgi:hypothetical protein